MKMWKTWKIREVLQVVRQVKLFVLLSLKTEYLSGWDEQNYFFTVYIIVSEQQLGVQPLCTL